MDCQLGPKNVALIKRWPLVEVRLHCYILKCSGKWLTLSSKSVPDR